MDFCKELAAQSTRTSRRHLPDDELSPVSTNASRRGSRYGSRTASRCTSRRRSMSVTGESRTLLAVAGQDAAAEYFGGTFGKVSVAKNVKHVPYRPLEMQYRTDMGFTNPEPCDLYREKGRICSSWTYEVTEVLKRAYCKRGPCKEQGKPCSMEDSEIYNIANGLPQGSILVVSIGA